jgi:hypothetical protein
MATRGLIATDIVERHLEKPLRPLRRTESSTVFLKGPRR